MNKSLQILFGLVLILVLAYVAFLDVSTKIKDDLLRKTKVMFSENNVRGVTANIKGEGLSIRRTLVLTGTAISEVERGRIIILTENIEGVCNIDNQIKLHPVVPKVPIVPLVPKVPIVIKVPVVKTSTEPVIAKSTLKEVANTSKVVAEEKKVSTSILSKEMITETPAVASPRMTTKLPSVPTVESNGIVVPTPVRAISAPNVIRIERIKLEGVK